MPLAYDVGAFDGADTAYYLSKGFRVIAVEADPSLAATLQRRFADAIADGSCVVVNAAIAERSGETTFYVCDDIPLWSSSDAAHAARHGVATRPVAVRCETMGALFAQYGTPDFLKVDIEGLDHLAILAIPETHPPAHVSFECGPESLPLVLHMARLGYTRFRLVNQQGWRAVRVPTPATVAHLRWATRQMVRRWLREFPRLHRLAVRLRPRNRVVAAGCGATSSGPLPSEMPDWMDANEFLFTFENMRQGGVLASSWFDIHAAHQIVSSPST